MKVLSAFVCAIPSSRIGLFEHFNVSYDAVVFNHLKEGEYFSQVSFGTTIKRKLDNAPSSDARTPSHYRLHLD